ncbi:MAG: hypothetical protein AB1431_06565 [Pseudomonadota bacterium]
MDVAINIFVAPSQCWSCGAETSIVTNLTIDRAGERTEFCVGDLTDYRELAGEIATQIPPELGVGAIKLRPSATMGRAYMSMAAPTVTRSLACIMKSMLAMTSGTPSPSPVHRQPHGWTLSRR